MTGHDDHGDDFSAWMGDVPTGAAHRTEDEWAVIAGYLRHAANKLGPALPLCLPGEPDECGRTAHQHVLAWAAAVKAAAQRIIEQSAPTPANAAYTAGPLYQRRLAELRARDAAALPAQQTALH
ncbi:hypothetical protein AB0H73_01395 [Streptomyces olivoreticuli]